MVQECIQPFTSIEIDHNGDVFTCCPNYIYWESIGNIYDEDVTSIMDIWHSRTACKIRQNILNGDYSWCNLEVCRQKILSKYMISPDYSIKPDLPQYITLAYDQECNLQCITCRDKK